MSIYKYDQVSYTSAFINFYKFLKTMNLFFQCLYCFKDKTCKPYPVGSLLPSSSVCPLNQAHWSKCFSKYLVFCLFLIPIKCLLYSLFTVFSCVCL